MPLPATLAATSATVINHLKITPAVTPKFQLYPQHNPSTLHFSNNPTTNPLPTTTALRCSLSSSSSSSSFTSTFPTSIKIPDVKYFPNEEGDPNLHAFFLRMLIRDDESKIVAKLATHGSVLLEWFEKKDTVTDLLADMSKIADSVTKGISSSLLKHTDAWVAGYSLVLHEICDLKFLLELFKLEKVFDQYAKEGSDDSTTVQSVELILMIIATGTTTDINVQSSDDLVVFLKSLKSNKGSIKFVLPILYPSHLSKEKLDKTEGYAHICLGKFP